MEALVTAKEVIATVQKDLDRQDSSVKSSENLCTIRALCECVYGFRT